MFKMRIIDEETGRVVMERKKIVYTVIDKVVGEKVEALSKEDLFDDLYNRLEEYGTTAYTHRELTEDEGYIIYIERVF